MKFATGLALAGFLSLGLAGVAHAQDPMAMFQCNAACSQFWSQCLTAGTDVMVASTPDEGVAKAQSNSANVMACSDQAGQCYRSCSGF